VTAYFSSGADKKFSRTRKGAQPWRRNWYVEFTPGDVHVDSPWLPYSVLPACHL